MSNEFKRYAGIIGFIFLIIGILSTVKDNQIAQITLILLAIVSAYFLVSASTRYERIEQIKRNIQFIQSEIYKVDNEMHTLRKSQEDGSITQQEFEHRFSILVEVREHFECLLDRY